MLLPTQFLINDPFSYVVRRVQPPRKPTPEELAADAELDSWKLFKEEFQEKYTFKKVMKASPHSQPFDQLFNGEGVWARGTTPITIGDYRATAAKSPDDPKNRWIRHWDGRYWSQAWLKTWAPDQIKRKKSVRSNYQVPEIWFLLKP